ncbi:hypothetical protein D8B45_02080 [Candidatus Gracilibacteria bacterium]|nr:MAG: hypothetical protein D8B45_02080 [Candidatus Gracilibacteria bacterium]
MLHGVLSEDGAWNAFTCEYWLAKGLHRKNGLDKFLEGM